MEVIGDETRIIVGVPEPAGIIDFMGEASIPGLGCDGSCIVQNEVIKKKSKNPASIYTLIN